MVYLKIKPLLISKSTTLLLPVAFELMGRCKKQFAMTNCLFVFWLGIHCNLQQSRWVYRTERASKDSMGRWLQRLQYRVFNNTCIFLSWLAVIIYKPMFSSVFITIMFVFMFQSCQSNRRFSYGWCDVTESEVIQWLSIN